MRRLPIVACAALLSSCYQGLPYASAALARYQAAPPAPQPVYYQPPGPPPPIPPQPVFVEVSPPPPPVPVVAPPPAASPASDQTAIPSLAPDPWAGDADVQKENPAKDVGKSDVAQDVVQVNSVAPATPKKLSVGEKKRAEQAAQKRADERKARKAAKEQARAEAKQVALEAAAAFCGQAPERRTWGSGYFGQKEFLEHVVNDTDGLEIVDCSPPRLKLPPNCWVIACSVRARNALGAKILTTWGFNKTSEGWTAAELDR